MSGQTKTSVVEIRVTPGELLEWKSWAARLSISVSELVRLQMRGGVVPPRVLPGVVEVTPRFKANVMARLKDEGKETGDERGDGDGGARAWRR